MSKASRSSITAAPAVHPMNQVAPSRRALGGMAGAMLLLTGGTTAAVARTTSRPPACTSIQAAARQLAIEWERYNALGLAAFQQPDRITPLEQFILASTPESAEDAALVLMVAAAELGVAEGDVHQSLGITQAEAAVRRAAVFLIRSTGLAVKTFGVDPYLYHDLQKGVGA